jgi:hypothetical protein
MQLTVDQILLLVHDTLAKYPASLAYNHARRKLGQARSQIAGSGLGVAVVEIPTVERDNLVVPSQDFGTSSQPPKEEEAAPSVVEAAPKEEAKPTTRRSSSRRKRASYSKDE